MKADGFYIHEIEHVSASSLNLWAAEPALWVLERLLKVRSPVGNAAHLGTATELAVEQMLLEPNLSIDKALVIAEGKFGELVLDPDDRAEAGVKLRGMIEQAIGQLRGYGKPDVPDDHRQHRVEVELEGVRVPCIGYTDFVFHTHGIVVDLKTSSTLPSAIKVSHARQGAVYAKAFGNYAMRFCYATPKKSSVYELENAAEHLKALANIARRLERFLRVSDDPHELAAIVCPDYESFYWSSPIARANGFKQFGF